MIKAASDLGLPFTYTAQEFFNPMKNYRSFPKRLIRSMLTLLLFPFRIVAIAFASHVVVLPLNSSVGVLLEVLAARMMGKRIVVDYYVSHYDSIVMDRKACREKSLRGRVLLLKEQLLIRVADRLIFLNQSESNYYLSVVGMDICRTKTLVLPLCVDYMQEAMVESSKKKQKSTRLDDQRYCVCWWGSYIPLHGLDKLITAMSLLESSDIILYIFGDNESTSTPYKHLVEQMDLSSRVSFDNSKTFINGKLGPWLDENCDLAVGNFGNSDKAKTVLVNKVVDSLALKLPCLTMHTKAASELLDQYDCLNYCENNPQDIAQALDFLSSCDESTGEKIQRGYQAYLDIFSPKAFRKGFVDSLL